MKFHILILTKGFLLKNIVVIDTFWKKEGKIKFFGIRSSFAKSVFFSFPYYIFIALLSLFPQFFGIKSVAVEWNLLVCRNEFPSPTSFDVHMNFY